MVSSQAWFRTRRNRSGSISLPDMAPFAGLVFLYVCFCLLTTRPKQSDLGLVSNERTPRSETLYCKLGDNNEAVVSLTIKQQLTFAVTSPEVQAAAIQQVALQHGVPFTQAQLTELKTVAYLRTDVENLPRFLSLPAYQRNRLTELISLSSLSENELMECIVAAKASAMTTMHKPIYLSLNIDSEASATHVEHLLDLLQAQGIHHFNLRTHFQ